MKVLLFLWVTGSEFCLKSFPKFPLIELFS